MAYVISLVLKPEEKVLLILYFHYKCCQSFCIIYAA